MNSKNNYIKKQTQVLKYYGTEMPKIVVKFINNKKTLDQKIGSVIIDAHGNKNDYIRVFDNNDQYISIRTHDAINQFDSQNRGIVFHFTKCYGNSFKKGNFNKSNTIVFTYSSSKNPTYNEIQNQINTEKFSSLIETLCEIITKGVHSNIHMTNNNGERIYFKYEEGQKKPDAKSNPKDGTPTLKLFYTYHELKSLSKVKDDPNAQKEIIRNKIKAVIQQLQSKEEEIKNNDMFDNFIHERNIENVLDEYLSTINLSSCIQNAFTSQIFDENLSDIRWNKEKILKDKDLINYIKKDIFKFNHLDNKYDKYFIDSNFFQLLSHLKNVNNLEELIKKSEDLSDDKKYLMFDIDCFGKFIFHDKTENKIAYQTLLNTANDLTVEKIKALSSENAILLMFNDKTFNKVAYTALVNAAKNLDLQKIETLSSRNAIKLIINDKTPNKIAYTTLVKAAKNLDVKQIEKFCLDVTTKLVNNNFNIDKFNTLIQETIKANNIQKTNCDESTENCSDYFNENDLFQDNQYTIHGNNDE